MRYILALWILCSVVSAEDIFKPTGKYLQVTTGDSEPVNLERTSNPRRFKFSSKSPMKITGRYLVKFTADYCQPCKAWERKERPILEAAGVAPTEINITNGNSWGVKRVPEFWVVDRETRKPIEKITGYTVASELLQMLRERSSDEPLAVSATKPAAVVKESFTTAMSHSEMVATHNRLHGGGQWTWPGDLASHLRTVHGVSTTRTSQPSQQPSIRMQQSACPGGRCPVPTNRRRMFR